MSNDESIKQDSPNKHLDGEQLKEGIILSQKEKVNKKIPPLPKREWKKINKNKKEKGTSTLYKISQALRINQAEQAIYSSLGFNLFGDSFKS